MPKPSLFEARRKKRATKSGEQNDDARAGAERQAPAAGSTSPFVSAATASSTSTTSPSTRLLSWFNGHSNGSSSSSAVPANSTATSTTIRCRRSFYRSIAGDSALTDGEEDAIPAQPRSSNSKSMRALFTRRGSTSSTETSSRFKKPFTPWLPPELWVQIFTHASSPQHPFLASAHIVPQKPLTFLHFPHSHAHLLSDYRRSIRSKATLTYVCKLWHSIGQEVLYEFIWITRAKEAAMLAELLEMKAIREVVPGRTMGGGKGKMKRHAHQLSDTTHFDYNNKGAYTYPYDTRGIGRHIRRLHIETNTLDRCSPQDLLRILDHAPLLQVYSDFQSIKRTTGFTIFVPTSSSTSNTVSTLAGSRPSSRDHSLTRPSTPSPPHIHSFRDLTQPQQKESDQQVLSALLTHPSRSTVLRRLSWTNYEYEPQDYDAVLKYYLRVVGPKLHMAKDNLEFLELTLCTKDLRGMTGQGGTGGGFIESLLTPVGNGGVAAHLTTLSASLTSTVTTTVTSEGSSSGLSRAISTETLRSISAASPLSLPALCSLKVTLDNATFHVLSTWDMPELKNLSVISADFSYAGEGFATFFEVHGSKLEQLELGHSTGAIEEHWLTSPPTGHQHQEQNNQQNQPTTPASPTNANGSSWSFGSTRVPLADWCPRLKAFICSADAEWNWQNPDWIPPHILLPAHPTVELIGIRDMEKRIWESLERVEWRDLAAVQAGTGFVGLDDVEEDGGAVGAEGDPFFMLQEQVGSVLRKEAFPCLRYVRDLSYESEMIRRYCRVRRRRSGMAAASMVGEDGESEDEGAGASSMRTATPSVVLNTQTGRGGGWLTSMIHRGSSARPFPVRMNSGSSAASTRTTASTVRASSARKWASGRATMKAKQERQQGLRVLRFWMKVIGLCKERGVWLEDCDGMNVGYATIRRAAAGGYDEDEVDG